MTNTNYKRWAIVNRNTLNVRTTKATRELARLAKRSNEQIFDIVNERFVR